MRPVLGIACLVVVLVVACGGGEGASHPVATHQVRGHIVEVIARSITEVETLRIRDESGREFSFTTEGFIGFTPSHLKEHQLFGQTVLVFYLEKGDTLVAVEVTD